MWWELSAQALDIAAALLALPAVVGSARLERARKWTATESAVLAARIAIVVRIGALALFGVVGMIGMAMSSMKGHVLITGTVPSWASTWTWLVALVCASIALQLGQAIERVARYVFRVLLWAPRTIAHRQPLAHILAGAAFAIFLAARVISVVVIVRD